MKEKFILFFTVVFITLSVSACSTTISGSSETSSSSTGISSLTSSTSSISSSSSISTGTSSSSGGNSAAGALTVPTWLQGAWLFQSIVGDSQNYWVCRQNNIYDSGSLINKSDEIFLYQTNISSNKYAFFQYTTGDNDFQKQTNGYIFIQLNNTNILVSNYSYSVFGENWTAKGNLKAFNEVSETIISAQPVNVSTPTVPNWLMGDWLCYPSISYNFTSSNIVVAGFYNYPGKFYGIPLTLAEASGSNPTNYYTVDYIQSGQVTSSEVYLISSNPKKVYVYKLVSEGIRVLSFNITNKN